MANVSIITATRPNILSKSFRLDEGGVLRKETGGHLVEGTVETRTVGSLNDFAQILTELNPTQATTYGVPPEGTERIVTRDLYELAGRPAGMASRTNDMFAWPDGPGFMALDYDPQEGQPSLGRDQLVEAVRQAAPELRKARMLWYPSASSCIWLGDQELRGIRGQRLFLHVADAQDIPRAGKTLADRLWLAGHGYIKVSNSGQMLERTLIDTSIWQPSRLDFAGGAACHDGLEQRRGSPIIIEAD